MPQGDGGGREGRRAGDVLSSQLGLAVFLLLMVTIFGSKAHGDG